MAGLVIVSIDTEDQQASYSRREEIKALVMVGHRINGLVILRQR